MRRRRRLRMPRRRHLPRAGNRINPHQSLFEGDLHVESVAKGNRTGCRDDRQPGVRHDRAGSDAGIALEEGRTVPGAGRGALRRRRERQAVRDGRLGRRQGGGRQLRVRPRHRQVDEEAADAQGGAPFGAGRRERQDLRDGWLRAAGGHGSPARRRLAAHRQRVAIRSGRRFLEVAAAAAHEARVGGGRRSRRQDLHDRWRDDDGRAGTR